MSKPQPIKNFKKNTFLDSCLERLNDTDPPIACQYCGTIKKEFVDPDPAKAKIIVLDCSCEREFQNYKQAFDDYCKCRINGKSFGDLIYESVRVENEAEDDIRRVGQRMLEEIDWFENLKKKHI